MSHFVELNSKNEDMLLEEIEGYEKDLTKMLLDDEEINFDRAEDEDENLLL